MERKILPAEFQLMDDHSLLIHLCTSHEDLKEDFRNHLKYHRQITIIALSATFMGIASFVVGMLLLLANFRIS